MASQDGPTDTTYIISNQDDDEGGDTSSSSSGSNRKTNSKLDTYLDERIDIPDADNVSRVELFKHLLFKCSS